MSTPAPHDLAARSRAFPLALVVAFLLAPFAGLAAQSSPVPPCCNKAKSPRTPGMVMGGRQAQGEVLTEVDPEAGSWTTLASMPRDLSELSAARLAGYVYVVGKGHPQTLRYDIAADSWVENLTWRPRRGHHHAAETWGGKIYLIGGLTGQAEGLVQIYDPGTDSWSFGAPMPFPAGSVSTALIDGKIYAAGGILDTQTTTDRCAVYDPALDSWTELAPMPFGRNHTAAGTDGTYFWVFGGRGPGSGDADVVANGFDDVQVYDPATDTWIHSSQAPRVLPRLPQARGGLGKAVWLGGEFYVFGGETLDGPGANAQNVYGRVDVFSPKFGLWRRAADMPTPRHGSFPLRVNGDILVPGGGPSAGGSRSTTVELFER